MLPTRSNGIFTAKQQQKRVVTHRPGTADFSCRVIVVRSLESRQRTEGCNHTHAHVIKQFRRDKTNMPPVHAKIHENELDEQTTETVGKMSHGAMISTLCCGQFSLPCFLRQMLNIIRAHWKTKAQGSIFSSGSSLVQTVTLDSTDVYWLYSHISQGFSPA